MPSLVTNKPSRKVAGVLLLVSLIAFELSQAYPITPLGEEDYEPALRAIIEELERQGLMGRMLPRAARPRTGVIRKSLSTRDFRLRYGKRSVSINPVGISLETAGKSPKENRQGISATKLEEKNGTF